MCEDKGTRLVRTVYQRVNTCDRSVQGINVTKNRNSFTEPYHSSIFSHIYIPLLNHVLLLLMHSTQVTS